jgi:ubiquinone/menaquinone biosynthesis C-methylase UbiE
VIPLLRQFLPIALAAVAITIVLGQCRKPAWWLGRLIVRNMNFRHRGVTNWGLSHVAIEKTFMMLDVGCGGGRTIDTLAKAATEGRVSGIDYSPASIATARQTNASAIARGQVDVQQGSVSNLPFPGDTFDLVTGVETHYYWPNLDADLREIRRVLKPNGTLLIIAETYRSRRMDWLYRPAMRLLRATYLSVDEHRALFERAGFRQVEVFTERARGWICAVGRKAQ